MGFKVKVGKKVEGTSDNFFIPDGTYVFQIVGAESTAGRVKMDLIKSDKQHAYKTFFIKSGDGTINDKAMRELGDFVTTAMQIEDEDCEVDVSDALGYYVQATLRNSTYISKKDGLEHESVEIHKPKRASGFPDGTPSLYEEVLAKREAKKNKRAAAQVEQVEEPVEEPTEEYVENINTSSNTDALMNFLGM